MKQLAILSVLLAVTSVTSADTVSCPQPRLVNNFSYTLTGLTFEEFSPTDSEFSSLSVKILTSWYAGGDRIVYLDPVSPTAAPVYIRNDLSGFRGNGNTGLLPSFQQNFQAVPEPGSMALLGSGLLALTASVRRRMFK